MRQERYALLYEHATDIDARRDILYEGVSDLTSEIGEICTNKIRPRGLKIQNFVRIGPILEQTYKRIFRGPVVASDIVRNMSGYYDSVTGGAHNLSIVDRKYNCFAQRLS